MFTLKNDNGIKKVDSKTTTLEEPYSKGLELYNKCDYSQAVSYFKQAAEMGNVSAQLKLGGCYWEGKGVEWNVREALKWHKKAAKQGDPENQYFYGAMCLSGDAVDELGNEILDEGIEWLEKAAAQGHKEAKKLLDDINGN